MPTVKNERVRFEERRQRLGRAGMLVAGQDLAYAKPKADFKPGRTSQRVSALVPKFRWADIHSAGHAAGTGAGVCAKHCEAY